MERALLRSLALVLLLAGCGSAGAGSATDTAADGAGDVGLEDASASGDVAPDVAPDVPPDLLPDEPLRVDLVPFARLRAEGTRGVAPLPWPREATDAIATVRDGHLDTGWKPLVGAPSTVEIDLAPLVGRAIALGPLAMTWDGAAPTDVSVALRPGCGLEPSERLRWDDPSTPLELGDRAASCVTVTLTGAADLVVRTLTLENADAAANPFLGPDPALPNAPTDATWGVIEGFYGVPWSWGERERMVAHMARHGLGAYLYAPKNDPLHRDRWREPYDERFRAAFAGMAAFAADRGVGVLFGVSPFLDYDFDSPDDYATLRDKLVGFLDAGAAGVALLADDIEIGIDVSVDAALGAAHVDVANRLLADLSEGRATPIVFWFVPTAYSDDRADDWPGGQAYLESIAQLDPRAEILWTGRDTGNATMDAADMDRFREATGRKPLIWDNFWANDGGDGFVGRITLLPFGGRSADLPEAVAGIAHNPSIQGALSRVALTTFAEWRADPVDYDAGGAIWSAAEAEADLARGVAAASGRDAALVHNAVVAFPTHGGGGVPAHAAIEEHIAALRAYLDVDNFAEAHTSASSLLIDFAILATLDGAMHHSGLATDLVDDLRYPLEKVRHETEAGLWTLALLGERLAGRQGEAEAAAARAALDASARCRFAWGDGEIGRLLTWVLALPVEDRGFWRVPETPDEPPPCRAGEPLDWAPFGGVENLIVTGLPGALGTDGRIRWTPPYAGRFGAIAVSPRTTPPQGWGIRHIVFTCGP